MKVIGTLLQRAGSNMHKTEGEVEWRASCQLQTNPECTREEPRRRPTRLGLEFTVKGWSRTKQKLSLPIAEYQAVRSCRQQQHEVADHAEHRWTKHTRHCHARAGAKLFGFGQNSNTRKSMGTSGNVFENCLLKKGYLRHYPVIQRIWHLLIAKE